MFFNLDKNSKQSLFNQYKQDAIDYRQKKNIEKQRRIQEEREYLAKRELLEKEADERIYREKLLRKNAQREEYNSMLMKTKKNIPGYRHNPNKNKDVVLNNWGGQEINHHIQSTLTPQPVPEQNNLNTYNNTLPQGDAIPWKGKKPFRNEDHLRNYLNDDRNDQELNNYIKGEKEYKQKIYKDLLYSQFQEAANKNLNLYGTSDPLIIERKRKRYLSQDPFAKNSNYDFSKSNLIHNPIVDPQNNLSYNKYLKFSESQRNMSFRDNYPTNNNNRNNSQRMQYQNYNNNQNINMRTYDNNNYNNNNNLIRNNNYNPIEEFKSNNYDTSNMNQGIKLNNNFNQNQNMMIENNQNFVNNNNNFRMEENQKGQNPNINYANNAFRPTPSGERIRQAAASNFF